MSEAESIQVRFELIGLQGLSEFNPSHDATVSGLSMVKFTVAAERNAGGHGGLAILTRTNLDSKSRFDAPWSNSSGWPSFNKPCWLEKKGANDMSRHCHGHGQTNTVNLRRELAGTRVVFGNNNSFDSKVTKTVGLSEHPGRAGDHRRCSPGGGAAGAPGRG